MYLGLIPRRAPAAALAFSLALGGIAASPALANIGVSPLRASIASGERSAAFTITNVQGTDLTVEAEVERWERVDGVDKRTKTDDWILNPPVMTIPAYGSRVIRMALKRPNESPTEVAYSLIVSEVHAANVDRGLGLAVKMHAILPVFLMPSSVSKSRPEWSAAREGPKRIVLKVKNVASTHIHMTGFLLKDAAGKTLENQTPSYVFPGESRSWTIELPPDAAATAFVLQVKTDEGVQTVPVSGQ